MRKNYIVNIILPALLVLIFGLISRKEKAGKDAHAGHEGMKSPSKELTVDSSIASLAKPVNAQVVSSVAAIAPEPGTRIFSMEVKGQVTYDTRNQASTASRVSGRIEKLYIKYNYQPVKQGQLIMEIYSPDLAAAQRELLFIAGRENDENMLVKAKQRLLLLGMQQAQINQVLKTGNIFYRVPVYSAASGYILEKSATIATPDVTSSATPTAAPGTDGMDNMGAKNSSVTAVPSIPSTPVLIREGQYVNAGQSLFIIYNANSLVVEFAFKPEITAQVKRGQRLIFQTATGSEKVYTGAIGLIQPVVRSGESFTIARVYISDKDLLPGQLVSANIPIVYKGGWWLPKKAVWQSGNKSIVFKKEGGVFIPKQVATIAEVEGLVLVATSIGDWMVAENAWYLVDSESFIKTTDQSKD